MIGNTVETYDYAVYGFLATVLAQLFFPHAQPGTALLSTFAVFGAAFVVRPLGAFVFGPLADRIGRRKTLMVTVLLMAVATPLIGLLPTAASIGIAAPILLVILRLCQGLSAAGEYCTAVIYAAEFSPERVRGRMTSRVQVGSVLGLFIAAVVVLVLNTLLSSEQILAWGWRIPFLFALPMGLIGLYLRSKLGETPEFEALEESGQTAEAPTREAFTKHWPLICLIFLLGSLHMIGFYMVYTYMQSYIISLGYTSRQATLVTVGTLACGIGLIIVGGHLADRWGRWRPLLALSIVVLATCYPLFVALSNADSIAMVFVWALLISTGPALYSAIVPVTYVEVLPANIRGTVFAVGYGLVAAVLGGSALYLGQLLVNITGNNNAPAFLLMFGAILSITAALWARARLVGLPPEQAHDVRVIPAAEPAPN
ncbi:proline/betaine transporter [Rhodococcus triatomae BKS 15-14]|nr:proline/betaine transporter [Rhodococcus triatomae BKS 15-14]